MKTFNTYYAILLTAITTALWVGSCQTKETDVLEEGSFKLIQTQIFDKSCATSGCHASSKTPPSVNTDWC